jgi:hypothetical protein
MRNPAEYNKALFTCMGFVHCAYLVCALIVYKYCGTWVTSPSLGVCILLEVRLASLTRMDTERRCHHPDCFLRSWFHWTACLGCSGTPRNSLTYGISQARLTSYCRLQPSIYLCGFSGTLGIFRQIHSCTGEHGCNNHLSAQSLR